MYERSGIPLVITKLFEVIGAIAACLDSDFGKVEHQSFNLNVWWRMAERWSTLLTLGVKYVS